MGQENSIVICMGSSCFARGNRKNLEVVEQYLAKHGVQAAVELSGSRCEECCQKGPNIRINGTMYHQVDSGSLIDLLHQHFSAKREA